MKKVLIFWLWRQWRKYVDFFTEREYEITWVTRSWESFLNIKYIYSYDFLSRQKESFFWEFQYIVVAVLPEISQKRVIAYLLRLNISNQVIVEKPVTQDISLLEKLVKKQNFCFFIDEIPLHFLYTKVFPLWCETIIYTSEKKVASIQNIFEHAIWGFLLWNIYESKIQKNLKVSFLKSKSHYTDTFYLIISKEHTLLYSRGITYIDKKKISSSIFFKDSLAYILSLDELSQKRIKESFLIFRKYFLQIKTSL